jgi:hypothetical protein
MVPILWEILPDLLSILELLLTSSGVGHREPHMLAELLEILGDCERLGSEIRIGRVGRRPDLTEQPEPIHPCGALPLRSAWSDWILIGVTEW